jgi:serine phosphatase RsbU (regulator of sigma subunit)
LSSIELERQAHAAPVADAAEVSPAVPPPAGASRRFWVPAATLILGLVVTGLFASVSHTQYLSTEKRLLKLRVRDAGSLVTAALPSIQTPLASAAELADATDGSVQKFRSFVAPYVGVGAGHPFVSVSLWNLAAPQAGPVAIEGVRPELTSSVSSPAAFFARVPRTSTVSVIGLLEAPERRLGYAFKTPGLTGGFAAYGESPLPRDRRSRLQSSSAFAGLDYALYLGPRQRPQDLLVTSARRLPLPGLQGSETVPFGDRVVTLVMSSRASLSGSLPQQLPWIIVVFGVLLSAGAAAGTLRLVRGRHDAEQLAARLEASASENRRLFAEQRSIAQTLQHALLPDELPQIPGVQTGARYEAGERGVDIGGDWYDVIEIGGGRVLLVVGDVSGRGLRAATTMASLRYAIRAYAAQDDEPAEILTKLTYLVSIAETGQLATVLCALIDTRRREISVTSAGHLPPLLISDGDGQYVHSKIGLPIGIQAGASYESTTIAAPPAATFLAYTDGLIERRGEDLDQGFARLLDAAIRPDGELAQLLSRLVTEIPYGPSEDDIAIVGLRWTT